MRKVKPIAPDCLVRGRRQIMPGAYSCSENHLHIIIGEFLDAAGYVDSPENRQVLIAELTKVFPGTVCEVD
jgi:hypothetical protein